ncbi:carboxylating nicotinate-nucleotide diphosphorylase [bacterium]|nr:carboxylating nicotinate-nucleotide diphosphorylase [bacterium]
MTPAAAEVEKIVRRALAEDIGPGDLTTSACVPSTVQGVGEFLAKQDGVLSGLYVVKECFRQAAGDCVLEELKGEGEAFAKGELLARVTGPAAQILTTERVALNFLQRLCGVATLTRQYVGAVAGTKARIVDTRKTTPGLRLLEKAAVRAGGATNHRYALYDGVILKDNHIVAAGGIGKAVAQARQSLPHTVKIEVETTNLAEVAEALEARAEIIMLDNMDDATMRQAVEQVGGRALVEASGGVSLETVAAIAQTGVDLISVGKLTHSAPSIDISLELRHL